jgi:hypothetical protein
MRIWEVEFFTGRMQIIFAPNRRYIWNTYQGVVKINEVVIH